ncbi:MAG: hypothetical protein KatS3mg124_2300 [Porticoccaceae bacterium]|nr:MAG: hypothetical protein KatS3mg124_2300 [Porticoccaceae bacterium]
MTPLRGLACVLCLALLAGCGAFRFPGVHRIEVRQGNLVTPEMAAKLELGMTKSQVRYLLGTPLLVDPFHQDRWDYYYSRSKGGELKERRELILFFQNDRLVAMRGDLAPAASFP